MSDWYSVKGLFRWYFKRTGKTDSIEERVLLFRAKNFDEAFRKAAREAKQYCANNPKANYRIEPAGWWHAYWVGEKPDSGVEVFSRLASTRLGAKAFVRRYYPKSHERSAG